MRSSAGSSRRPEQTEAGRSRASVSPPTGRVASAPVHPPARSNRAYRGIAHVIRPMLRAMTRKDWPGTENLPTEGGFIAASNHMTNIDPLTFAYFLWENGFAPKILAKASLFKVPVMRNLLHATGQIPVYRNTVSAAESLDGRRHGDQRRRLRGGVPRGHADAGPRPVADGRQDGRGQARADHPRAGHPGGAVGRRSSCCTGTKSCFGRSRARRSRSSPVRRWT